jgi:O-antigen/teichoic acid export membrane protein
VAVLALGMGAIGAASVVLITSILSFLISSAVIARRIGPPRWRPDRHIWARTFLPASSFFVIAILLTLENMLGPLLLSRAYGPVAVGTYTAAATLINLLQILPISFRKAVLPLMAQAYATRRAQAVRIMGQSLRLLLATTLFLAITASLLAAPVLQVLYRGEFAGASSVFILLVWAFVFTACAIPHGRMIVVANHQGRFILFHVLSLLINLGLVLWWMPTMGAQGVALATLLSSAFLFFAGMVYVVQSIERWPVETVLRGPLIAGALMLAVVLGLQELHVPLLLAMLPGWCLYGLVLWELRVFSMDDMRLLRQFIRRQRTTVLDST